MVQNEVSSLVMRIVEFEKQIWEHRTFGDNADEQHAIDNFAEQCAESYEAALAKMHAAQSR